jgi:hypothetical protein
MPVTVDTPLAWTACHDAPGTVDPTPYDVDSVIDPGAPSTHYVETPGKTTVKIRLKRVKTAAVTTNVVVLAYGKDTKGDFRRLEIRPDNGADEQFEATLVVHTNDLNDGTDKFTEPYEVIVSPVEGFQLHIKTALVGGGAGPEIQMKLS